jgi:hypothetical protein
MTLTEVERPPYQPPVLEILGTLTSLAEGSLPSGSFAQIGVEDRSDRTD